MFSQHDVSGNACQLFGGQTRCGRLVDEVIAENIGCEYGEYNAVGPYVWQNDKNRGWR